MTAPARCRDVPLPSARGLTWEQAHGRACIACGEPLTAGRVYRGAVLDREGAYLLDFEVWSCPDPKEP
ncbi:hypothetical protein [Streptomyces sp. NBC_01205]|uniref:hypothetical protein n=1 Tax=Streptomyces sp. NBC_01205 TaxID=2903771 RepID=UPI002E0D9FCB|nr:hypothetical protein OG573_01050 [Streptomyces sp. NBC_01205]